MNKDLYEALLAFYAGASDELKEGWAGCYILNQLQKDRKHFNLKGSFLETYNRWCK